MKNNKQHCIICAKMKSKMFIRDCHFSGQGICESCEKKEETKLELGLE